MFGALGRALDDGHVDAFFFQQRFQVEARRAPLLRCDCFRGADRDDVAALDAAVGAEVDDPVGGLDDVDVMFGDGGGAFEGRRTPLKPPPPSSAPHSFAIASRGPGRGRRR